MSSSKTSGEGSREHSCLFCGDRGKHCSKLKKKSDILATMQTHNIKYTSIKGHDDYICFQCIFRIRSNLDFWRRTESNITRNRLRSFWQERIENLPKTEISHEGESDLKISCVQTLHDSDSDSSKEPVAGTSGDALLLDVLCEKVEPLLATESGGNIIQYDNFSCEYCSRTFERKSAYKRHVKTHRDGRSRSRNRSVTRSIKCTDCDETFENRSKLRAHEKAHRKQMLCQYCSKGFYSPIDFEIHEAECRGKHEAKVGRVGLRRSTRCSSRKSAVSSARSSSRKSSATSTRASCAGEDDVDDDDEDEESVDEDEESVDEVSEVDSMFTIRQRNVNSWIEKVQKEDEAKKKENLIDDDEFPNEDGYFACPQKDCTYQSLDINDLNYHDVLVHPPKFALFFCPKCDGRFTRRCYLDYHLKHQDVGLFVCHKCYKQYKYRYQLKQHWDRHNFATDFPCDMCDLQFVSKEHYEKHSKHSQRGMSHVSRTKTKTKKVQIEHFYLGEKFVPIRPIPERCKKPRQTKKGRQTKKSRQEAEYKVHYKRIESFVPERLKVSMLEFQARAFMGTLDMRKRWNCTASKEMVVRTEKMN